MGRRTRGDWPLHPIGEELYAELLEPHPAHICGTCGCLVADLAAGLHLDWHVMQEPDPPGWWDRLLQLLPRRR